jgi:hypothetical protein
VVAAAGGYGSVNDDGVHTCALPAACGGDEKDVRDLVVAVAA